MEYGFENTQPDWSTAQQLWILAQVTDGKTQQAIYDELIAHVPVERPVNVERWEGTFGAFKKRLQRLTRNGIDPAIDTETGERCEFNLGTARGRYDYWIWLAKTTTSTTTRMQALTMIEKLAPRFCGDRDTKVGSLGSFQSNGQFIVVDWQMYTDLVILALREQANAGRIDVAVRFLCDILSNMPDIRAKVMRALDNQSGDKSDSIAGSKDTSN